MKITKTAEIGNGYQITDLREILSSSYGTRQLSEIDGLVVHHSAVAHDSPALDIAAYHVTQLGWPSIGYHFLVHQDGDTEWCNDLTKVSYHVAGRNQTLVGICLPGDWSYRRPPAAQLTATRRLVAEIQYALGWFVPVLGHCDAAKASFPTSCPGYTWPQWRELVVVEPQVVI